MMGRIIRLHDDAHREAQLLLPWYVTGALEPSEQAQVEAHLGACPECQSDLSLERRLEAEIAALPMEIEHGWNRLAPRLRRRSARTDRAPSGLTERLGGWAGAWRGAPPWLGWALAGQIVLVCLAGVLALQSARPARYQTLGALPQGASGNVVVIFRPRTLEGDLRRTLQAADARLVDGPTAAGAYVLRVPPGARSVALASLRARTDVLLAEPVDATPTP